jgi:hypothetical protein
VRIIGPCLPIVKGGRQRLPRRRQPLANLPLAEVRGRYLVEPYLENRHFALLGVDPNEVGSPLLDGPLPRVAKYVPYVSSNSLVLGPRQ